ncbi:hypothetical protein [Lutibacter sp.]|uniref:IS1096 element passenger TnpR family protein n=1 Tax=Lutibacter sp. TaxID=1925666 RepID=UPI003567B019
MAYKIRVILDVEKDVFRDIVVNETTNLEDLHFFIAKSFGFNGQEMASFYRSNNEWEQGDEIPLFDMSEDDTDISMSNCLLNHVLTKVGDKLIYVYDFFSMWTFFVELSEITTKKEKDLPKILLSFGFPPEQAPEKKFKADKSYDDYNEFLDSDDFEDLENIDDNDFYN